MNELIQRLNETHSKTMGYLLWIFGFTGSHRFYYGRPITGTIWLLTGGLVGIGWLIDIFFIPSMDEEANIEYGEGPVCYNLSWILLTFTGFFGLHRIYMGKFISGILYFLTVGFAGFGVAYDYWTLNKQISELNSKYDLSN